jgi:rhodanese-related sulfurtransferase
MTRKIQLPFVLLTIFSLILGACATPAATPPAVVEPTVAPTTAPTLPPAPTEEPKPDVAALFQGLIDSLPADKGYGTVKPAPLSEELASKPPFLLDVRESSEVEKDGYIEGAIHIPIRDLLKNLDKLPGLDEPIVVYCGVGHRGALAFASLKLLGYTDVRNLAGGLGAWKKAELPVVTGSLPAEAPSLSQPMIADQPLFTMLDEFLTGLPEGFYSIKSDKLNEALASSVPPNIVDVRTAAEFDKDGYIEGAVNVPMQEILGGLDKLPAADQPLVINCVSGHRGAIVMMALRLMGYSEVTNLAGGLNAWKAANLPVVGWVNWPQVWTEYLGSLPADQGYYTIKADALNTALIEKPPFLLDVREASEIEKDGYIEGAIHISISELLKNLDKLPAQDERIVAYCASGHRGGFAVASLRLLGYTDVVSLAGGLGAWKKANLPIVTGSPPAAPAAGTAPEVDATRLRDLDAYLSALPEGFYTVKAPDLNTELIGGAAPFILDVRTADEFAADGHIEGAVNLPVTDVLANLSQLPADKAAPIVVLCKSGHRGAMTLMALQMLGYSEVRNLAGGMNAWTAAELPVAN